MNKEQIAAVLKAARAKANMTQVEVSAAINRPQQTLASWETGKSQPDANTLFQLFDLYGQSVDEAFGYSPRPVSALQGSLTSLFSELNEEGQEKLVQYAGDLVASGRYIKNYQSGVDSKEA